jgi:hypothetical protein
VPEHHQRILRVANRTGELVLHDFIEFGDRLAFVERHGSSSCGEGPPSLFERESHLHRDLKMSDTPVANLTADVRDLEPAQISSVFEAREIPLRTASSTLSVDVPVSSTLL